MPRVPRDIVGQRFGRLVVSAYVKPLGWRCLCDCGAESIVKTASLNSGNTSSCGCLGRDRRRAARLTHGHSARTNGHSQGRRSKAYIVWTNMLQRCVNPKAHAYAHYGGRGISVCERWHAFENFLADMGEPPLGLTLDRVAPDGDYEPANCRWADWHEQQNNRRNNHLLTLNGETHGITEWSRRTGVYRQKIRRRLKEGWPVERALTP